MGKECWKGCNTMSLSILGYSSEVELDVKVSTLQTTCRLDVRETLGNKQWRLPEVFRSLPTAFLSLPRKGLWNSRKPQICSQSLLLLPDKDRIRFTEDRP